MMNRLEASVHSFADQPSGIVSREGLGNSQFNDEIPTL
jgi:hypothetical protein